MQLIEIENEIKELIAENIENPKVYQRIYDLVYFWLKRKHLLSYEQDYEEVAHIGATDLYMKVYSGGSISSWLGYLSLAYMSYIKSYRKMYRSEIIDTVGNPDLADAITLMSASSSVQNPMTYDTVTNISYIENHMIKTIDEVLEDSKFMEYTKKYYNAKLTILISILAMEYRPYYIDEEDIAYTHMLYVKSVDSISGEVGFGEYSLSGTLWQYTVENLGFKDDINSEYDYLW